MLVTILETTFQFGGAQYVPLPMEFTKGFSLTDWHTKLRWLLEGRVPDSIDDGASGQNTVLELMAMASVVIACMWMMIFEQWIEVAYLMTRMQLL